MPVPKFLGDRPPVPGDRQVPSLPTSKIEPPAIQSDRWFRCGRHPDATVMNQLNNAVNFGISFRSKEVFGMGTILGQASGLPVSSAAGTRTRWRFSFHTGIYHHALFCRAVMYPQSTGYTSDSYSKLTVYSDVAEATPVVTAEFHYGANPLQSSSIVGWQHLKIVDKYVEGLTANTTYYARVDDVDYGLIQSLAVGDLQSMASNYAGYLPSNFTAETPIFDEFRANLIAPLKDLWKRGGGKVLNWSVDLQSSPKSITSATPTNLIDETSTTYGSSIPGFTINMTGKARLSQPLGVPCVMKVFGRNNGATALGRFYLKDSTGATIAVITDGWGIGTPAWQSVAFNLPATSQKVYLVFDDNSSAGAFQAYACSIFEYET